MRFGIIAFAILLLLAAQAEASNAGAAIDWLKQNQNADGSFNPWFSADTSAALLALYANDSTSANTTAALRWLGASLRNTSSDNYATWGEADTAGLALHVLFNTNYSLIDGNLKNITATLRSFQAPSSGFRGWWTPNGTVEDSVDTSWSLLGLLSAGAINDTAKTAAVNYLQSRLQNQDGSINLTGTTATNQLSALGLDAAAQTSLALLALNTANGSEAAKQNALLYVKNATCAGTGVFGASMAALALENTSASDFAAVAARRIATLQNASNGGFSDVNRGGYPAPNAIDTGFAAYAMQRISDTGDITSVCAPYFASYLPSTSLELNNSILKGTLQKISLKSKGGWLVAANAASANISVTYEGTESVWLPSSFNPQTGAYEAIYGNTARTGIYLVSATLAFASNTAVVNRTFTVTAPTSSPAQGLGAPGSASSNPTVSVTISFPPSSGSSSFTWRVPANSCSTAYECLSGVASLTCHDYANLGCMITAVNGVAADYYRDNAWWAFCYNGQLSSNGVSNQRVAAGDTIMLRYVTGSERGVSCNTVSGNDAQANMPALSPVATPALLAQPTAMTTPTVTPAASPRNEKPREDGHPAWRDVDENTRAELSATAGNASVVIAYTAGAKGFSGNITYRFDADYTAYANGSLAFSPKPALVKPGSVIAVWSVDLPPNSQFNVTLRASPEYAASIFANLSAPLLQKAESTAAPPVMLQNASVIETPRSSSASGFAIARSSAVVVAAAILISIIGFALLIIRRNARR